MMLNNYSDDCSKYSDYAEWLRLSDILNDWCKSDNTCKEVKKLAILGACENGEIEYTRNDGKDFDDPVMELQGRGLLLINKRSFNEWKNRIEQKNTTPIIKTKTNLLDFVNGIDTEYISVGNAIDAIHKHIGLNRDINEAVQVLNLAIGRTTIKPIIYRKFNLIGWEKVTVNQGYGNPIVGWFREDQFITEAKKSNSIKTAIALEMKKREDDDLPF